MDLAGLDKNDLKHLGLSMLESAKVLHWARAAQVVTPATRSRTSTGDGLQPLMGQLSEHGQPFMSQFSDEGTPHNSRVTRVDRLFQDNSDHIEEVEARADFWCRLVTKSDASYLRAEIEQAERLLICTDDCNGITHDGENFSDFRETLLEKLFDLSPHRLAQIYDSIDRDSDGRIQEKELREGLLRCELHGLDGAIEKVFAEVSRGEGSLQLHEFESVLTRLKLAQLICTPQLQRPGAANYLSILDYNSQKVEEQILSLKDYFFGHRPPEFPMRWIHMRHFDLTLLLALTVKYQLHPLGVEDVLHQTTTKIDRYDGHYFVAIEHLEVKSAADGSCAVEVCGHHITMFCAGPPHLDTILTVAQADSSFKHDWPGSASGDTSSASIAWGQGAQSWDVRLQKRLRAVRSRVRERRADFLMYEILDLCADDMRHVTRVYMARVSVLEDMMEQTAISSDKRKLKWFNEVSLIRLQVAVVMRRLRGLQRLLRRLTDDQDLSQALTGYLEDVIDHVNEAYEDAGHLVEKCRSMSMAYEHVEDRAQEKIHREAAEIQNLQDGRMNKLLFILTVIATVFTPLTFVAGVYGMNFVDEQSHPTIPELLNPHGYLYFWVTSIVYLLICVPAGIWLWRRIYGKKSTCVKLQQKGHAGNE